LIAWVLVTIPFAVDQAHSFTEWRKLAGRFLVFYWALLVFQRQRQDEFLFHVSLAVVVGVLSLSGYAIWDFFERGGTIVNRGVRALAPSSHSHWLATYVVIAWPLVFFLLRTTKSVWKRLLLTCLLLLLSVAEFLAFSRGAWIAIAFQIGFGAFMIGGRRMGLVVMLGIALSVVGLWSINQKGYLGGVFEIKSMADRLGCWKLGMEQILAHPMLGAGFGNDTFAKVFPGDPPGACSTGSSLSTGAHLHNTLLMVAMGSGIPAFIFLMWIFVRGVHSLLAKGKFPRVGVVDNYMFRVAIALVLVGFWVSASFNYLFTGSLAYLFVILLAVGMSMCWYYGSQGQKKEEYLGVG
jgi:O-antigen ligase